jgi:predicted sulfurtransferase
MGKILLYYKYVTLNNLEKIVQAQQDLCSGLNIKGRIILAIEGINGTVGGSLEAIEQYKQAMKDHDLFGDIDFKESEGDADCFPRLRIIIKKEIVHLGLDPALIRAEQGGIHLTPEQSHQLLENRPKDLVVLDARNKYESDIGFFEDSITPPIQNFRDLPAFIENNKDLFKDKQVLMHCTGGIRCERASAYLKSLGIAKKVYQIKGGIHKYLEQYPQGYFKGKNYVFDARIALSTNKIVVGKCFFCEISCDDYTNCVNTQCNQQIIVCMSCQQNWQNSCSAQCKNLIETGRVKKRDLPSKRIFS